MGKASSAKKVARAARSGGKTSNPSKNIAFPAAIVALLVLGVGLVVFARTTNPGNGEPALGEHWHSAYGIYVCDRWVANLDDRGPDSLGIHTHGDGLIHIHPFLSGAAGGSATIGKFFDQVGLKVKDSSITLPPGEGLDGRTYENGKTTCDGKAARVVEARWDDALTAPGKDPDAVRTSSFGGQHFDKDGSAYTLAFVSEGTDIPAPPAAAQIQELGSQDGGTGGDISGVPENNDLGVGSTPQGGDTGNPASIPGNPGASDPSVPAGSDVPTTDPPPDSTEAPPSTEAPAGG